MWGIEGKESKCYSESDKKRQTDTFHTPFEPWLIHKKREDLTKKGPRDIRKNVDPKNAVPCKKGVGIKYSQNGEWHNHKAYGFGQKKGRDAIA